MVTLHAGRLLAAVFHGPSSASLGYRDGNTANIAAANLYWKNDSSLETIPDGFRPVPGFFGYFVSGSGEILSQRGRLGDGRLRPLSASPDGQGYLRVTATDDTGRERSLKVHLAVITAFRGPRPSRRHEARHLDGEKGNNSLGNLQWGLPVENASDRVRHGTHPVGERSPRAKITDADALLILQLWQTGRFSQTELAEKFGVSKATVGRICRGEAWKHILTTGHGKE